MMDTTKVTLILDGEYHKFNMKKDEPNSSSTGAEADKK